MDSTDDQVQRVLNAWDDSTDKANYAGVYLSMETQQVLARQAVEALQCGEPHPDRCAVRCTQLPHGNGHLYHRNSELGIEWWASGDRTTTIHDVLGSIYLGQPLPAVEPQEATRPVPCPECRWIRQDGRDHSQLTGGWTRCAHCGHEWNGPQSRPSTWCRAKHPQFDADCDTLHHPRNTRRHGSSTYGVQWVDPEEPAETDKRGRYHTLPPCEDDTDPEPAAHAPTGRCGVKHPKWDWYCDRDTHGVNPDDHETWHHDRTKDRYWTHAQDSAPAPVTTDANQAVYRDLIPILGPIATFLDQIGKRYREGNPRTTADQCRSAEGYRDQLTTVVDTLLGMTGAGTDD